MAKSDAKGSARQRELLKAALKAAGLGIPVIPVYEVEGGICACGKASNCRSPGKHPRVKDWQAQATTDEKQIRDWWKKWPTASIGGAGGALICLDVDAKSGGFDSLSDLEAEHGEVPAGAVVKTGKAGRRRGRHYWFSSPDGLAVATRAGVRPGVDIRAVGGFAVLPPSLHASGVHYEWDTPPRIEPAPEWILDLAGEGTSEHRVDDWKPSGQRPSREVRGWLRDGDWPIGEQQSRIPRVTRSLLDWGKCADEIVDSVFEALERSDQDPAKSPWTRADVEKHVRSIAGSPPPPKRKRSAGGMLDRFALTDQGNAERFAETFGEEVCWVPAWKTFVYWRGDRWERDAGEFATARMVEVVKALGDTARELEDDDLAKRIFAFAARSLTQSKIGSALALAKPLLFGRPTDFDSDRWLLNCRNGTLDLRKLELREHRREDMLTQQVSADYDPDARSKDWDRVVRESMQSDDLVAYLQKVFGYSLVGDTREEVFFFFYGKSGAGKGTVLESFGGMLGDYARTMSHRTLTHVGPQSGSGASEDVARLHGARFVVASEFERGSRLAEAFVNTLTGGDKITARQLYQSSIEFLPQLTLFLAANHKPRLSGSPQSGIWRRLVTVPFEHVPKVPDKALKSRLATAEARAAILAWAVEGLRAWQAEGLGELPAEIELANEEYREEVDPYSIFIKEQVKQVEGTDSTFQEMYVAFCNWWDDSGRPSNRKTNITTLNRILRERGFEAGKRYYKRRGKRTSENVWKDVEVRVAGIRVQGPEGRR